ncbi:DNA alkylation repair protein [Brachybacterium vulturis]|uniref:DNA alkylation repair protein n=1 Tax=Brachybacterium vulturis TaxID=2017484 RepID=UPI003735F8E5
MTTAATQRTDAELEAEVAALHEELAALADDRMRAVNRKHGDDHAVNLTKLRAIAKRLKTRPDLARALWSTPAKDSTPKLLALLISRPKQYDQAELDAMLREAPTPKVHDWLVSYMVKKSPHREALREAWFVDADPVVTSAGWALTSDRIAKAPAGEAPDGIDLDALLEQIEAEMKDAPERLQWAMNQCLAEIGIHDAARRERAKDIGERLEVLKDYPTPPNCTSPFAPVWIDEMVRRAEQR